jgi:cobalt-zinc-cadmium efflux system membrane fusion protein
MRIFWVIVISAVFCSCESRTPSASASSTVPGDPQSETLQKDTTETGVVVLDQTQQQKGHIAVEPAEAREVSASLTIPGRLTVSEDQTWHIGAIANGRIESISAHVGDFADAGQILGRIHSHEVHEARAGYQQAVAELERARFAEEYAKQRRDRAQHLFELRAGSRQDLETAEADLRNAQAAIRKGQSDLEKERAHMNIFQVPLEEPGVGKPGHDEGDDIPILAPASGLVFERKATVASVVNSGDELFTISDTSSLWMIAAANESDLSRLRAGQQVRVHVRAFPDQEFSGRILKLGEKLDPDTRTLQIRILVPNPQGRLKPEMYATASLQQSRQHRAVLVPETAVQEVNGVPVVFIRRAQNEFETRTVRTGQQVNGEAEILEGLRAGEAVVVTGSFLIKSQLLKSTINDH